MTHNSFTVRSALPLIDPCEQGLYVEDPEQFYPALHEVAAAWSGVCHIQFVTLPELDLSGTPMVTDIYRAVEKRGGSEVPYGAALRLPHQHQFLLESLQIGSCLIGINRIPSEREGDKYAIELYRDHFRYRRADDHLRFTDLEIWGFAFP
jgi:hypothetical protein